MSTLLDVYPVALAVFNATGERLYSNQVHQNLFGDPSRCFKDYFHDPASVPELEQSAHQYGYANQKCSFIDKNHSPLSGTVQLMAFHNQPGYFFVLFMIDGAIEQSDQWEKYREDQLSFRPFITQSPNLILIYNKAKDTIKFINRSGARLLAATDPVDLIGHSLSELMDPDASQQINHHILRTIEKGQALPPVEMVWKKMDGEPIDLELTVISSTYDGQDTIQMIGMNITERKKYLHSLAKHIDLSDALLESSLVLNSGPGLQSVLDSILQQMQRVVPCRTTNIMLIEDDYVRVVASKGYAEMLPHGTCIDNLVIARHQLPILEQIRTQLEPVIINDTRLNSRWKNVLDINWLLSYACVPLVSDNEAFGYLNLDSDEVGYFKAESTHPLKAFAAQASIAIKNARLVEDLRVALQNEKDIREHLIETEKLAMMGRMLATVAHELNNPLQTIQNCLFIIRQNAGLNLELSEQLSIGLSEVSRLSELVGQLRNTYRPQVHNRKIPVNLIEIIQQVYKLVRSQLEEKKVTFGFEFSSASIFILAAPDRLKQVFLNLIQNAVEAMEPSGGVLKFHVKEEERNNSVQILIEDYGRGIPLTDIQYVFDPFFTTRNDGTGMGLAICKEIIQFHAGDIYVESYPGIGTRFTIKLPILNKKGTAQNGS